MTTFNNGSFSFNPANTNTNSSIIKQGLQQTAQIQDAQQVQQAVQFNLPTVRANSPMVSLSLGQQLVNLNRFANPADKVDQKNRINDSIQKFGKSALSSEIMNLDPQLANNEAFVNAWIDQPLDFMDEQI
jgi:hypothetical protein